MIRLPRPPKVLGLQAKQGLCYLTVNQAMRWLVTFWGSLWFLSPGFQRPLELQGLKTGRLLFQQAAYSTQEETEAQRGDVTPNATQQSGKAGARS